MAKKNEALFPKQARPAAEVSAERQEMLRRYEAGYVFRFPKPRLPMHGESSHAGDCMAVIRDMLAHPKPPGNWWAKEVMAKVAAGQHVSVAAYELAKKALARAPAEKEQVEREAGEDREEDDGIPI